MILRRPIFFIVITIANIGYLLVEGTLVHYSINIVYLALLYLNFYKPK